MGLPDNIVVLKDPEEVAQVAADRFAELAAAAGTARLRFGVALAGGSTPKRTYELLASEDYRIRVAWPRVHIFFSDERCVPPEDLESNYRMTNRAMLSTLPIPTQNIHRMIGEGDPAASARLYEDELQSFFEGASWPRFDLIFLGMGDDGHTASLFPGTTALKEERAWVAPNWIEKFKTFRITLSAPAINHAAHILFLVTGENKARRLAEVMRGPRDPARLPAQAVQPVDGSLEWLVDKAAAAYL